AGEACRGPRHISRTPARSEGTRHARGRTAASIGELPRLASAYSREMREVRIEPSFESWQSAARLLLREGVPPDEVQWNDGSITQASLLTLSAPRVVEPVTQYRVPAQFIEMARRAVAQSDRDRWSLLYRVLWRSTRE